MNRLNINPVVAETNMGKPLFKASDGGRINSLQSERGDSRKQPLPGLKQEEGVKIK